MSKFGWEDGEMEPVGICGCCVHLLGPHCDAYPAGIPDEILLGELDHHNPLPGDNGIQFEEFKEAGNA